MISNSDMFSKSSSTRCDKYNTDNIFERFQIIEFPISFVGLSTSRILDVEIDLIRSGHLKTMFGNKLMKFSEAWEISASHRAFDLHPIDSHTVSITYQPKTECISRVKHDNHYGNRFVFDLRLIQADGNRCCNNEFHSEIGRYYVSGEFEYCNLSRHPNIVDFGDVIVNSKVTKHVRLRNESSKIAAKLKYIRITGFEVTPQNFSIPPNSSRRLTISLKPTCLLIKTQLTFHVRNPHDNSKDTVTELDGNYLTYTIPLQANVMYNKCAKEVNVESLHKLVEKDPTYTYTNKELETRKQRKEKAYFYLDISKKTRNKKPIQEKDCSRKDQCLDNVSIQSKKSEANFCTRIAEKITTYELFDVEFSPFVLEFGRVGLSTYGEEKLTLKNNSKCDIVINFVNDDYMLYTKEKLINVSLKLKSESEEQITVYCLGLFEGRYERSFQYNIDGKYCRKHPYRLQVGNPTLMVLEKSIKFGMVTTEYFITSVPLKIYNNFNIDSEFQWDELHQDTPFEIIPSTGIIPKHTCRICDILYSCKSSKSKTHEVDLITGSKKVIPVELNIVTRKLSIKFLQPAVIFKDIALNVETIERVKLENASREIAIFHIVEPLIPGLRIEPMSGVIGPKMVITFEVIVKISCIIEFAFDVFVKINNKENIALPVSGNLVEPKLIILPKNIYMPRIPCNMISYVPIIFQNTSPLKCYVEVLDTEDDNIFKIYIPQGNEKQRVFNFEIEGGQSKTVYIKVYDIFRREYEMYIPFKINDLLGPPDLNSNSTDIRTYIEDYERSYENNPKVKLKTISKDIAYCRITGVITVPWIQFSQNSFEIDLTTNSSSSIDFTMKNISKYNLNITILTSKLAPTFTLELQKNDNQSIINETHIKLELESQKKVSFTLKFHPKGYGKFVTTALLYLDKQMTTAFFNLTFIGRWETPALTPSTYRIVFPPCHVGHETSREMTLLFEGFSKAEYFSCMSQEESNVTVKFLSFENKKSGRTSETLITIKISVLCETAYSRNLTISFSHICGSGCEVDIYFCFTYCPLTLHTLSMVEPLSNPYPYYPLEAQSQLFEHLEISVKFLEKWMFQQGFRRDLYPTIPDTFHAISTAISAPSAATKSKGINVSYLNFVKRIAGPLMKHVRKIVVHGADEPYKCVKEIHDTYKEIIKLLKSRGADLWFLQAKFLLSYEQFVIYIDSVTPKCNSDIIFNQELRQDIFLFNRLNKQSWIDFILQSYKVFVMDSCFFECVCISSQPRDIIKVLIAWYNEQIAIQHKELWRKTKSERIITNITTDLSDGIAIASAILNYCQFLNMHYANVCEIDEKDRVGGIINNACLNIEAMNMLKLNFPLQSIDFLQPNFIQMLFLSIHLYVALPMFKPKDTIKFNPPLLRSSSRQVTISPSNQESLLFTFTVLNNLRNSFTVEKAASTENGKKTVLNVKFVANFTSQESCILLVHGYNKTRIFDTFMVFQLHGHIGSLSPLKKCKVTGPLYRPNKVDVFVSSPFFMPATFQVFLTDNEPTIPVFLEEDQRPKFYISRLTLIDKEIRLTGAPKESAQDVVEHKLYLQIVCLSTQISNSWIWFKSDIGEFFIKVTSHCRWDLAIDTLQARVKSWPLDPCSCGEACECYRTSVLVIPHRNELMLKSLRYALLEHASEVMLEVYDRLIETTTGKIIIGMLLAENGTNMSDVQHILRSNTVFRISSRALLPRIDRVKFSQHSDEIFALPITIPVGDKPDKYSITFTSECGNDIRTYRILFIETSDEA